MAVKNTCPSCGAENDVIFDKCLYCRSPLNQFDMKRISNEDLITNASEWIAKSVSYVEVITDKNEKHFGMVIPHKIIMQPHEVRSYAEKYLNLLLYRSADDTNLENIYNKLFSDYQYIKSIKPKKALSRRSQIFFALAMILIFFLLFVVIFGLIVYMTVSQKIDKERNQPQKQIERREEGVEVSLDSVVTFSQWITD